MKLKRWTSSSRSIDLTGVLKRPLINASGDHPRFITRRAAVRHARLVQGILRRNTTWQTDVVAHKVGEAPVWPSDGSNQ